MRKRVWSTMAGRFIMNTYWKKSGSTGKKKSTKRQSIYKGRNTIRAFFPKGGRRALAKNKLSSPMDVIDPRAALGLGNFGLAKAGPSFGERGGTVAWNNITLPAPNIL